jgi:predicted dehydrogenase
VVAVKKLLDQDRLGRIYSIHVNGIWNRNKDYYADSWKGNKNMDGGILYTQFSHFIDLLYWIAGDVKHVHAYAANIAHNNIIEFEDTTVACVQFMNGALGSIHFSINSHLENMEGSLLLVAEKGTVKIGGKYLDRLEYQHIENHTIGDLSAGNIANDYGGYMGSMSNHDKVYQHVFDVISHNTPNQFDGQDALKTVEIIEKIYKAADEPAL